MNGGFNMENESFISSMRLRKLVFDKISFERKGFKNENEVSTNMSVKISENIKQDNFYKVSLTVLVEKKEEYDLEVTISGFFSLEDEEAIKMKDTLLQKNAIAILMPYVRSEISMLTAQPETDCVLLPLINTGKIKTNDGI